MSKLTFLTSLALVLSAHLWAQSDGRLTGSVIDPSGAAITDATVNVYIPGGKVAVLTMKTTSAGIFDFASVRPATYRLEVIAKGFTTVSEEGVTVDPARAT